MNNSETVKLSELKKGQRAVVTQLNSGNLPLRRRLLDMGLTEGVEVEIKKVAPLGDPVNINLRGYDLLIRRKDMSEILVEVVG